MFLTSREDFNRTLHMALIDGEITLAQAAKLLPKVNGKAFHVDTLKRWIAKGCRGVRLEAWRRGGRWFTSEAALEKFRQETSGGVTSLPPRTDRQRKVAAEAARERLRRNGFYGRRKAEIAKGTQAAKVPALS